MIHIVPFHLFCHIHNLFHGFLDWLCHCPVKSCTTSAHSFLQQELIVLAYYNGFHGFFCDNDGFFNGVVLPDAHNVPLSQDSLLYY